ncbi:MAG: NADH-quinone oxidoreductase subunit J [Candidatus Paracaedibacteraceae bacterium]|nr:NADH-quinone oxidoreductase subunit J [Candidatus Paracaedibacteraceae bacterium]
MLAYLFSGLILAGAIGVIISRKPVYSVLFLIFSFLNASALYILLGAEFIALSTIILYVGAVAVLLLFVVMTLTEPAEKLSWAALKTHRYWIGGMAAVFALELILAIKSPKLSSDISSTSAHMSNIKAIGSILYTKYGLIFQCCAVLLLVAMVSAVIVTFQSRSPKNVKRQKVSDQINRNPDEILKMVKVKNREGI